MIDLKDKIKSRLRKAVGVVPKIDDWSFLGIPRPSLVKGKKWILN